MNQVLKQAIENSDWKSIREIIQSRPHLVNEANDEGETLLMCAVKQSTWHIKCVRLLLEAGADVNARTKTGGTALMDAVWHGSENIDCVKMLLAAGADVNAKTKEGYTVLHHASGLGPNYYERNPYPLIEILVQAGARMEEFQHYGWTPLMYALIEGTLAQFYALLALGANPNQIFPDYALPCFTRGRSTLAIATIFPDHRLTSFALKAGADVRARDHHGQTALEYAQQSFQETEDRTYRRQIAYCISLIEQAEISREHREQSEEAPRDNLPETRRLFVPL